MSFGGPFSLYDPVIGSFGRVSPQNRNLSANPTRLVGAAFNGTITPAGGPPKTGSDYFWYLASAGGASQTGAAAIASNVATVAIPSGTVANDWALIRSQRKARLVSGQMNAFVGVAKLSAASATSAVTYFGPFTPVDTTGVPNDGFCFAIGPTGAVSVQGWTGGSNTALNLSSGFNGTLGSTFSITDTNYHRFEIIYFYWQTVFLIDNQVLHKATVTNTLFSPVQTNNVCASMVGTGVTETSGRTLTAAFMMVERYGQSMTRPQFAYPAATTALLKSGAGTLHAVIVGDVSANNDTLVLYDNTAASGSIITTIAFAANNVAPYTIDFGPSGLDFQNGLYYSASSAADLITVVFD